jgi:hypothetical protein
MEGRYKQRQTYDLPTSDFRRAHMLEMERPFHPEICGEGVRIFWMRSVARQSCTKSTSFSVARHIEPRHAFWLDCTAFWTGMAEITGSTLGPQFRVILGDSRFASCVCVKQIGYSVSVFKWTNLYPSQSDLFTRLACTNCEERTLSSSLSTFVPTDTLEGYS